MKKHFLFLAVIATSAVSSAAANFTYRGDLVGTAGYNDATNLVQNGASYFQSEYARISGDAKITESVTVQGQLDFLQINSNGNFNGIRIIEVNHRVNELITISMGKLADAGIGGFETLRPEYEQFFVSQNYLSTNPLGASADFLFSQDQQLKVVILNQNWDNGAYSGGHYADTGAQNNLNSVNNGNTAANSVLGYGARYRGSFGPAIAMISYDVEPTYGAAVNTNGTGARSNSATNTYIVVSGKWIYEDWKFTGDYMLSTFGNIGTSNSDNGTKNTIVLMADWNLGRWSPHAKVEQSTLNDVPNAFFSANGNPGGTLWNAAFPTGAYSDNITRANLGVDYLPTNDSLFKYAFNYVSQSNIFSGSGLGTGFLNKTIIESAIFVSMTAKADFLK